MTCPLFRTFCSSWKSSTVYPPVLPTTLEMVSFYEREGEIAGWGQHNCPPPRANGTLHYPVSFLSLCFILRNFVKFFLFPTPTILGIPLSRPPSRLPPSPSVDFPPSVLLASGPCASLHFYGLHNHCFFPFSVILEKNSVINLKNLNLSSKLQDFI